MCCRRNLVMMLDYRSSWERQSNRRKQHQTPTTVWLQEGSMQHLSKKCTGHVESHLQTSTTKEEINQTNSEPNWSQSSSLERYKNSSRERFNQSPWRKQLSRQTPKCPIPHKQSSLYLENILSPYTILSRFLTRGRPGNLWLWPWTKGTSCQSTFQPYRH